MKKIYYLFFMVMFTLCSCGPSKEKIAFHEKADPIYRKAQSTFDTYDNHISAIISIWENYKSTYASAYEIEEELSQLDNDDYYGEYISEIEKDMKELEEISGYSKNEYYQLVSILTNLRSMYSVVYSRNRGHSLYQYKGYYLEAKNKCQKYLDQYKMLK